LKKFLILEKKRKFKDFDSKAPPAALTSMTGVRDATKDDENEEGGGGGQGGRGGGGRQSKGKSKKRQAKDEKYGFGGVKRGKKKGDAKSARDMNSFNPRQNDDVQGYGPGEKFKGKKKNLKVIKQGLDCVRHLRMARSQISS